MFKKNPIINLFLYTWRYSIGTKKLFIAFVLFSIIANVISLFEPIVIGRVFNNVQFSAGDPELLSYLVKNLSLLILITLGFWLFHGTSRIMERRNAFLVRKNYKQEMFDKVMDLPVGWHKDHHSGDTIDKINKASENLHSFAESTFFITQSSVMLFGSIIVLAFFDWRATAIALAVSIISIGSILQFDRWLRKMYVKIFRRENYLSAGIYDYIGNIITVITLRLKSRACREIDNRQMKAFPIFLKLNRIQEFKWFLVSLYITLMTVGILILNAYKSFQARGLIVIGTLFVLYQYLRNIGDAFYNFAWRWGEIVHEDAAVRAAEVIRDAHQKLTMHKSVFLPNNWKVLQLKKLSFTYPH